MDDAWIELTDEATPDEGRYLVVITADWTPPRGIIIASFNPQNGWWFDDPLGNFEITHYQALPALPRRR